MSSGIYNWYASVYGIVEVMFRRRLAAAIAALPVRPGDHLLDVGVGTGFSLSHYPADLRVTGIDLSGPMLQKAVQKLPQLRPGVPADYTRLQKADALNLPYADGTFDLVFLSHVVSTVSDPQRCLREALRVAKPHAYVMLVNHFRAESGGLRVIEKVIDPVCRHLGWRTDLSLRDLLEPFGVEGIPARGPIFQTVLLGKTPQGLHIIPLPRRDTGAAWRPALGRSPV